MTDRISGYIVTLEKNLRTDDAEAITKAIEQIRGVLSVKPYITTFADHVAEERVRQELSEKLWQVLHPKDK